MERTNTKLLFHSSIGTLPAYHLRFARGGGVGGGVGGGERGRGKGREVPLLFKEGKHRVENLQGRLSCRIEFSRVEPRLV